MASDSRSNNIYCYEDSGIFKEKKRKKNLNNYYNNDRDKEVYSTPVDDYTTGEIIDVEYEDVDKKEK